MALRAALLAALLALASGHAAAQEVAEIKIGLLTQLAEPPPKLSNLDQPAENEGAAGGALSIKDNNTTGQFLGQRFSLAEIAVPPGGDALAAFQELAGETPFIVVNAPADALLQMADWAAGKDVLIFNAGAPDDRLRSADCRDNVMHVGPSRAMLADALAQYLATKRWRDWFLIVGRREGDQALGRAFRRAAKKFGARIVTEKAWDFGPDARRTAQAEVPAFTQGAEYDVLVVADEIGEFAWYLEYRSWEPRPVAGSAGLTPTTWARAHEQWGAAQLQSRFFKTYGRRMTPIDYQVWAPIRAIGEGATRTNSNDFAKIRDYIRGPDFELAGFKGQPLTFRDWNWQLRQPILLTSPKSLVSASPQDGFLHERSLLDTMGLDKPESECRLGG